MKSALVVLALFLSSLAHGQATSLGTVLDVKTTVGTCNGAIGNGVADDAPAFTCHVNLLSNASNSFLGGLLHVPAGTYFFGSTVDVPTKVTVEGVGEGSVIAQTRAYKGVMLKLEVGSQLRHMKFTQVQPAPGANWVPYQDYDFQIALNGGRINIEDILLLNPANGIRVYADGCPDGDKAIGQIFINDVRAQPLHQGIVIDCVLDVIHINNVHFWPFWSADASVIAFTSASSYGIRSFRDDNPFFSQLFMLGYYTGIEFGLSGPAHPLVTGKTSRPRIDGFDCDGCATGIRVTGAGTNGILVNKMQFNGSNQYDSGALLIATDHVSASISQLDATHVGNNVIRVDGDNNYVLISDSLFRWWNVSGLGYPAISTLNGTNTKVQFSNSFYGIGGGAPLLSGNVTTNFVNASPNIDP